MLTYDVTTLNLLTQLIKTLAKQFMFRFKLKRTGLCGQMLPDVDNR